MNRFLLRIKRTVAVVLLIAFSVRCVTPAFGESPVKLQNWRGTIDFSTEGVSSFTLAGTASAQSLVGAGATFPYPIYSKWFDAYNRKTGVAINYQSIGSGGGIRQFTQGARSTYWCPRCQR